MKIKEITEARKNPEQNPKHSISDIIFQRADYALRFPGTSISNDFVSFTSIEKLGVNPRSPYKTPIGVYAYPTSYVYKEIGDRSTTWLPFAGDKPYANFFKLSNSANVIISSTFKKHEYEEYLERLAQKFGFDEVEDLKYAASDESYVKTRFGFLWYVTYKLSSKYGKNGPVAWNKIMRDLGIDAMIDDDSGTIHENEPTQIVIFNVRIIEVIDRVRNTRSKEITDFMADYARVAKTGDMQKVADWIFENRYEKEVISRIPNNALFKSIKYRPGLLKYVTFDLKYQKMVVDTYPQYLESFTSISNAAIDYAISKGMAQEIAQIPALMRREYVKQKVNAALGKTANEPIQEKKFMGSQCTKDCSGHKAGYKWSVDRNGQIENTPSQSFNNGTAIGKRQFRQQGGGKVGGQLSMSPEAIRKRNQRAAKKNQ